MVETTYFIINEMPSIVKANVYKANISQISDFEG